LPIFCEVQSGSVEPYISSIGKIFADQTEETQLEVHGKGVVGKVPLGTIIVVIPFFIYGAYSITIYHAHVQIAESEDYAPVIS